MNCWRWLISMVALCSCVQTSAAPIAEPASAPEREPTLEQPAVILDARPLDPELAALLGPEALAAAAEDAKPKPPPADLRTPSERAREACERRCTQAFNRDRMVRQILDASRRGEPDETDDPHGSPPELSDEDGLRRFINGEPSIIWVLDGDPSGQGWSYTLYINPDLARVKFPFHGLLFEIDAGDRVVRCRYAERGEPEAAVDMACELGSRQ